jgi:hypothetical protein
MMQAPVQGLDLGESRMMCQALRAYTTEPLAKPTLAVSLVIDISLVRGQTAGKGPDKLFVPLLMVEQRLIDLAQRLAQAILGETRILHSPFSGMASRRHSVTVAAGLANRGQMCREDSIAG